MLPVFLNNFKNEQDVFDEFRHTKTDEKILFAWYGDGSWSGAAFVLFSKDGKLFEVNASHCSCYGLEDQWDPEETTADELRYRMKNGSLGSDDSSYDGENFAPVLEKLLSELEQ